MEGSFFYAMGAGGNPKMEQDAGGRMPPRGVAIDHIFRVAVGDTYSTKSYMEGGI
jgi:hypothetical protein